MANHENNWDKLLQIQTCGRDETNADEYHHPYEPTPYSVLDRLANSGLIGEDDVVLDYGCGKGRVGFFLSYRAKAKTIGIEYDDRIYQGALNHPKSLVRNRALHILAANAQWDEEKRFDAILPEFLEHVTDAAAHDIHSGLFSKATGHSFRKPP